MANLQIRVDDTVRDRAREVAAGMGMDLGEAVRIFQPNDSGKRSSFSSVRGKVLQSRKSSVFEKGGSRNGCGRQRSCS